MSPIFRRRPDLWRGRKQRRLIGYNGVRVGEADNPGPLCHFVPTGITGPSVRCFSCASRCPRGYILQTCLFCGGVQCRTCGPVRRECIARSGPEPQDVQMALAAVTTSSSDFQGGRRHQEAREQAPDDSPQLQYDVCRPGEDDDACMLRAVPDSAPDWSGNVGIQGVGAPSTASSQHEAIRWQGAAPMELVAQPSQQQEIQCRSQEATPGRNAAEREEAEQEADAEMAEAEHVDTDSEMGFAEYVWPAPEAPQDPLQRVHGEEARGVMQGQSIAPTAAASAQRSGWAAVVTPILAAAGAARPGRGRPNTYSHRARTAALVQRVAQASIHNCACRMAQAATGKPMEVGAPNPTHVAWSNRTARRKRERGIPGTHACFPTRRLAVSDHRRTHTVGSKWQVRRRRHAGRQTHRAGHEQDPVERGLSSSGAAHEPGSGSRQRDYAGRAPRSRIATGALHGGNSRSHP